MAILAIAFVAIGGADSAAILHGSRYHGVTTAAMLMRGAVMDIEAEYQEEGFPSNTLINRRCELPRPFNRRFSCSFDLERLEMDPAEMQTLVEQGVESFMGHGESQDQPDDNRRREQPDDDSGLGRDLDPSRLAGTPGAESLQQLDLETFDATQLMFLAPLLGPEGHVLLDLCNVNFDAMLQRFMGMATFFPIIVQQASDRTRKLTVRLSWDYGPRMEREFAVSTFIVGLPEEQMRKMREAEKLQESQEQMMQMLSPDGGVPTGGAVGGPSTREGAAAGGGRR